MLIFNENDETVILDSIHTPVLSEYFWCFNAEELDFMLSPLNVLEEITSPMFVLTMYDFDFMVPSNWNILIYDRETAQVDVIEIATAAGKEFSALVYGPKTLHAESQTIRVTGYHPVNRVVAPLMNKHQMLCHPVNPDYWVCVTPHNVQKITKNVLLGDIMNYN
jgi:hypothetical protein